MSPITHHFLSHPAIFEDIKNKKVLPLLADFISYAMNDARDSSFMA